jgi:hypothetical protein
MCLTLVPLQFWWVVEEPMFKFFSLFFKRVDEGEKSVGSTLQEGVENIVGRTHCEGVEFLPGRLEVSDGLMTERYQRVLLGEPKDVHFLGAFSEVFGFGQGAEDQEQVFGIPLEAAPVFSLERILER